VSTQVLTGILVYFTYIVRLYQGESSQRQILNAMEIGIVLGILCKGAIDLSGLWPYDDEWEDESLHCQVLLQGMCEKCEITEEMTRRQRYTAVIGHLVYFIASKKEAIESNQKEHVVRQKMMSDVSWRRMRFIIEENVNLNYTQAYVQASQWHNSQGC
jgi:hypothetical protein